jgi:hypothetical protein
MLPGQFYKVTLYHGLLDHLSKEGCYSTILEVHNVATLPPEKEPTGQDAGWVPEVVTDMMVKRRILVPVRN